MEKHYPVLVIGGGQAGLSISYCLKERGIAHLVFEKEKIGHSWRSKRWDTFCLVTPNWQCMLPGFAYQGDDPNGFMQRDEIVGYIEAYAASFEPLLKEGVEVMRVGQNGLGIFEVTTSIGDFTADQVVVATGGYHLPKIPRIAERLPDELVQLHSSEYRNPALLPEGAVLVVGTGQSGCQIAEDLHLAGRQVHLCVGGAPRSPRRYRGKDVVDWLDQMGYYDLPIDEHPQKETLRHRTNHYVTGRGGGREIDLRQFALEGMKLYGRLKEIQDNGLEFCGNLKQNLDQADAVAESIKKTIDAFIDKNQIDAPTDPPYRPVWEPEEEVLSLDYQVANIKTVIWSIGYETNFRWVEIPVFDGKGYPGHDRGVTPVKGLYFLGLPWLYTWGSGRFSGIARDARYLADYIVSRQRSKAAPRTHTLDEVALLREVVIGS
ncbi:MSMEG_0569 family flavin-dependent oxidoreductase [Pseudanabaena sp. FACHB-2040]|uniref:MSMEG_0569 family flavin-dependent oxidoreductase n=1 Tax=Pseudanabaena sp. FACHB-2040 TaxID=2692859 RepID=UPI001686782F|nr:MSMEG_0569 family flavin-dependent oxidoreductase [Pseudanabaena sp. FACHB-2040]MBD2257551.1 MSMEG_0569 family flavin-dependent oxidoreductase [Pseudanabaena sp. FACHB-2040]